MRARNWHQYNKSLVERGSLTFLIDPKVLKTLVPKAKKGRGRPRTVIRDGAYDDRDVRSLIKKRGGRALVPPPKNAVCRGIDLDRDDAVRVIRFFGGDKIAKSIWGKVTDYSRRALVETTFSRYKKIFWDRFFSRTQERQLVENRLKCVLLNKMMRATA